MTDNNSTQKKLAPKNDQPGCITLTDIPNRGTTLIMQRYLLTMIETQIDREDGIALASALLQHFDAPAPMTIPHGHGPVGGFHALLDEARVQDHTHISLSRGHGNLLAEHIRLLEEQLAALQAQVSDPERVRRLNEQAAIINLLGYVQDGSDQVVTLFQDDATLDWVVKTSQKSEHGRTLAEALRAHFPGADEESQQINKSLSTGSRPVSVIPDECAATGQSCSYRPDGPNGESQCQYCGKSEDDKNADV